MAAPIRISNGVGHFTRRPNVDQTYDSICMQCFQTIGTAALETALDELEKAHASAGCLQPEPIPLWEGKRG